MHATYLCTVLPAEQDNKNNKDDEIRYAFPISPLNECLPDGIRAIQS